MNSKTLVTGALGLLVTATSFASLPVEKRFECSFQGQDLKSVHATLEMTVKNVGHPGQEATYVAVHYASSWDKTEFVQTMPVKDLSTKTSVKLSDAKTENEHRFSRWDDLHLSIDLSSPIQTVVGQKTVSGYTSEAGFKTVDRYIEAQGVCVPSKD